MATSPTRGQGRQGGAPTNLFTCAAWDENITKETMREQGVKGAEELALERRKSLYGLRQAGQPWSQLLHERLVEAGFNRCESDMWFYWMDEGEDLFVVGVYLDDLLVTGTSADKFNRLFESLASLSIRDLG